ncbi:MAG: hypothetical protein U0840_14285 [Gemmataceae bacterium]
MRKGMIRSFGQLRLEPLEDRRLPSITPVVVEEPQDFNFVQVDVTEEIQLDQSDESSEDEIKTDTFDGEPFIGECVAVTLDETTGEPVPIDFDAEWMMYAMVPSDTGEFIETEEPLTDGEIILDDWVGGYPTESESTDFDPSILYTCFDYPSLEDGTPRGPIQPYYRTLEAESGLENDKVELAFFQVEDNRPSEPPTLDGMLMTVEPLVDSPASETTLATIDLMPNQEATSQVAISGEDDNAVDVLTTTPADENQGYLALALPEEKTAPTDDDQEVALTVEETSLLEEPAISTPAEEEYVSPEEAPSSEQETEAVEFSPTLVVEIAPSI